MIGVMKNELYESVCEQDDHPQFPHMSILCEPAKFLICETNTPHKRLSTPKRHHKTSMHLKPLTGKIHPITTHVSSLPLSHMRESLFLYSRILIWKSVKSPYIQLPKIFWCMKNVYCDWYGEEMVLRKRSEARQLPLVFAHKYFGKTSTRKLFICESEPSKPVYQFLICENNLACSEINLTAN